MAQATLTARVDEKDKINFDAFCSNVGLNTSTAINLFVKAVFAKTESHLKSLKADDSLLHGAGGRMADASQSEQEE